MSKMPETFEAEEAIVQYLKSKKGARLCCQQIAKHCGLTMAACSRLLMALSNKYRILISTHKRDRTYFVACSDPVASPSPEHTPANTPPLKVDKNRIELYRELAAARAAIKSIG